MLLQNSSTVYSRKVEYLHSLVYESLEALLKASDPTDKKGSASGAGSSSRRQKSVDPDVEEFEAFDPDWNFLVFEEDTIPVDVDGHSIDLPSESYGTGTGTGTGTGAGTFHSRTNTPSTNINMNASMMNNTRMSMGGMSVTRLDQTLKSVTQNKTSIQSHAAQQLIRNYLGNQANDFSRAGVGAGSYDPSQIALRLMSGLDVHESGALLLPGTMNDTHDLDDGNGIGIGIGIGVGNGGGVCENSTMDGSHAQNIGSRLDMNMEGDDNDGDNGNGTDFCAMDGGPDDYDNGDDDDDGDAFVIHSPILDDDDNGNDNYYSRQAMGNNGNRIGDGSGAVAVQAQSILNHDNGNNVEQSQSTSKEKESSPWDMLDPHDDSETKARPLRVATTYRLPADCDAPPSASVTGGMTKRIPRRKSKKSHPENDANITFANAMNYKSIAVEDYRHSLLQINKHRRKSMDEDDNDADASMNSSLENDQEQRTRTIAPLSMKGLAFGDEFLYVAKAQAKLKAAEKRRLKRKQSEQRNESNAAAIVNEKFSDMYDDNDDDQDGPAFDFGDADDDDYSAGNPNFDSSHEDSERSDTFGGVFGNVNNGDNNMGGANQRTFEELCRAHLKEFAKGAERFAVETHSRKVSSWQAKVEVILAREDERPKFDINEYGDRIISLADDGLKKDKSLTFGENVVSAIQ